MRLTPLGNKVKKHVKVKPLSLPRLELLAVLTGTQATKLVVEELNLCISKKVILTDSQCVLHWIKRAINGCQCLCKIEWMKYNYWRMSILVSFPPKTTLQILQLEDLQFQKSRNPSYGDMAHPGCSLMKEIGQAGIYLILHQMKCFSRRRMKVMFILRQQMLSRRVIKSQLVL